MNIWSSSPSNCFVYRKVCNKIVPKTFSKVLSHLWLIKLYLCWVFPSGQAKSICYREEAAICSSLLLLNSLHTNLECSTLSAV